MLWRDILREVSLMPLGVDASSRTVDAVVYDSRRATKGSVFVCLSGANVDGHDYAPEAYRRGCRIFVTARTLFLPKDAAQYQTADTRAALADISASFFGHADKSLCLVGVTGTKGKTTVSCMAAELLNRLGIKTGYIGSNGVSYGTHSEDTANTTPESYELHRLFRQMADDSVRVVVMEVSSQALFMRRVFGLTFPITVFTNLAPDHIGPTEHPTYEHYRDSKATLFSDYGTELAIFNADDVAAETVLAHSSAKRHASFSLKDRGADYFADNPVRENSPSVPGVRFSLTAKGATFDARLAMPGAFNVSNALAALATADGVLHYLGQKSDMETLLAGLSDIHVAGRFEAVPLFSDRAFIIDYAHNGYSLSSVLSTLREYRPKRLVCLVGSVGGRTFGRRGELGAAASDADLLIITSDNPDREDPAVIMEDISKAAKNVDKVLIADRREAIFYAVKHSAAGDIVLLAGKGHERYQLIRGVKEPFCERELLMAAAEEAKLSFKS